jgi:hypothetical protein
MRNQFNQIYDRLKSQHKQNGWEVNEARLRQQAWMLNDRIVFEATNNNAAAASSAAAGAGAGAGGGSGNRRSPYGPVTLGYTELFLISEGGTYQYFIFDFTNEIITPLTDTKISSDTWSPSSRCIKPIQETGYLLEFNYGNLYQYLFVNDNGATIKNLSFKHE